MENIKILQKTSKYRADIDGLRAVAVLAVVFFHSGWKAFGGGYVGVDVFFVISGFLITQVMLKDIREEKFSIAKFYERRIRRIFPAFFTLAGFVLAAGLLLYNQANVIELTQSVFASSLFWANILFWRQAGYWDGPSLLKPMLHTWSLSVEEQFYIFYPLTLYFIMRFWKNKTVFILWGLLFLSLGFAVYVVQADPNTAFYMPHLRAWELLLGCVIAINPVRLPRKINEGISLLGLGMILFSVFTFNAKTVFPGAMAILPVFGTGFLINAGINGETYTGKLLAVKPMVFIGKISYSLYLWHWPLLVFGKYYLIVSAAAWQIVLLITVSFLMAILSWRYVETPFREPAFLQRNQLFGLAACVILALIGFNMITIRHAGFPSRYSNKNLISDEKYNADWKKWADCTGKDHTFCLIGKKGTAPDFFLFGDSHAKTIAPGVDESAKKYGKAGYYYFWRACVPLIGVDKLTDGIKIEDECSSQKDEIVNTIRENKKITRIIISARWVVNYLGTTYKSEDYRLVSLSSPEPQYANLPQSELFYIGLKNLISSLSVDKKEIYIVLGIPEVGYDVPSADFIGTITNRDINHIIAPTKEEYLVRNQGVLDAMKKLAHEFPNVTLIDPAGMLCSSPDRICHVKDSNNYLLYVDTHHLSTYASLKLSTLFDPVFEK